MDDACLMSNFIESTRLKHNIRQNNEQVNRVVQQDMDNIQLQSQNKKKRKKVTEIETWTKGQRKRKEGQNEREVNNSAIK